MRSLAKQQLPARPLGMFLIVAIPSAGSHCNPVPLIVKVRTLVDPLKLADREVWLAEDMPLALVLWKSVRKDQPLITYLSRQILPRDQLIKAFGNSPQCAAIFPIVL
jgi:hypothetical protein